MLDAMFQPGSQRKVPDNFATNPNIGSVIATLESSQVKAFVEGDVCVTTPTGERCKISVLPKHISSVLAKQLQCNSSESTSSIVNKNINAVGEVAVSSSCHVPTSYVVIAEQKEVGGKDWISMDPVYIKLYQLSYCSNYNHSKQLRAVRTI